jgi:putative acetyltransferase
MNVRTMTDLDRDAVVHVHRRSARELAADAYGERVAKAWAGNRCRCDYDLDDPDTAFVVAVTAPDVTRAPRLERSPGGGEGDVAGFGAVDVASGEVVALYVSPTYASEGVGTRLLGHLEGVAREGGVVALAVTSSRNAVGFYESHGYAVTGEATVETTGNDDTVDFDVRVMEKSLSSAAADPALAKS